MDYIARSIGIDFAILWDQALEELEAKNPGYKVFQVIARTNNDITVILRREARPLPLNPSPVGTVAKIRAYLAALFN